MRLRSAAPLEGGPSTRKRGRTDGRRLPCSFGSPVRDRSAQRANSLLILRLTATGWPHRSAQVPPPLPRERRAWRPGGSWTERGRPQASSDLGESLLKGSAAAALLPARRGGGGKWPAGSFGVDSWVFFRGWVPKPSKPSPPWTEEGSLLRQLENKRGGGKRA